MDYTRITPDYTRPIELTYGPANTRERVIPGVTRFEDYTGLHPVTDRPSGALRCNRGFDYTQRGSYSPGE